MSSASADVAFANSNSCSLVGLSGFFKRHRSLTARRQDADTLRERYREKIPIIIERYSNESNLPRLEQSKFLVPCSLTIRELIIIIRRRLNVNRFKTFYLLVNNRTLVSNCATLSEIYELEKDDDGFLYMVYASQETFGGVIEERLSGGEEMRSRKRRRRRTSTRQVY